uniref:Leucine rich repeat containing 69 n=1 Tax=Mastacembelus armatus TaxID=205130 RepID=A0A3Q3M7R8_9TELE
MAESVVRALYGKSSSLNLSSKKVKDVPKCVSRLTNLSVLLLNNNSISSLPAELLSLQHVSLHLNTLNLQHLSVLDNKLEEVPAELGHLAKLSEINLTSNNLSLLPQQLCQCKDLTKLHLARNKLTSLPELTLNTMNNFFRCLIKTQILKPALHFPQGIRALEKLQVLDVAGNKLSMFPVEFHLLSLKELYCEGNRFVHCKPVPSVQDEEVLTLKELAARFVLREDRNRSSLIHRILPHYPYLTALLASGSCCALCQEPFLTTWLECVHFINLRKDMKMRSLQTIPVRALLCSYKCFNTDGHCYYGVVTR